MIRRRRAEKLIKIFFCVLLIVTLISSTIFNCFAYGAERDTYNSVIADEVLPNSLDWDVTFKVEGQSSYDDNLSTNFNTKFNPLFLVTGMSDINSSDTYESASSQIYIPNAGYYDTLLIDLATSYFYDVDYSGLVTVDYSWSFESNENYNFTGVQFQTGNFYYTYDPDIPFNDMGGSPFVFYFIDASSVTTMITYHELGNAVDVYSYTFTDDSYGESGLVPEFFGYSEDEAFTVFIDSVVVIPDYDSLSNSFDMQYAYDGAFCQFSRAADLNTHVTPPSDAVFADYTSWIGTAVSGFLDFQIFPGFSFGGLLMVIISFSVVIWFLKLFAGG